MAEGPEAERDPVALEDLRQRLYRRGASGSDVQDYLDRRPEPAEPPAPEPDARRSRGPRRRLALALLAAAVLLVAVVLVRPGADRHGPSRPATSGLPVLVDVGDGQLLDVGAGRVAEPTAVTTAVAGVPVLGRRVEGRGSAVVAIPHSSSAIDGGRAVIAVATDGSARVRWRALLEVERPDWTTAVFVLASGVASRPDATAPATTFVFPARPPTAVAVAAPRGVRWALVAATTEGLEPALH